MKKVSIYLSEEDIRKASTQAKDEGHKFSAYLRSVIVKSNKQIKAAL